ncbi:MAG TPA: L,D-transpeptidase family protein [Micropepsaceae bacterium]|nr:L,D-transpeptidase family protein [Micropepsaceae bacterium]
MQRSRDPMFAKAFLRASAVAVAALAAASCAGMNANKAPNTSIIVPQDPAVLTQSALRNTLLPATAGAKPASSLPSDPVLRFYQARNFLPAWDGTAEADAMAGDVRAVLARAHEQGLSDEDYKMSQPDSRRAPGKEAAEYDLAITRAVLRYAREVRTGRVRPDDVYDDIILPVAAFDPAKELNQALANHAVAKLLDGLPPAHPQYRQLVAALAQYRKIADAGGWPALPGQSEIKLEGNDPRLSALVKRLGFEDSILAAIANPSAAQLHEAVKRFQARNGLEEDGRVGGETLAALGIPASFRVAQIAANMERWRWMPAAFEHRYIAVNVPDQSLDFVRDGSAILHSRVIVGRKSSPTPITRSTIVAIVANPPWNIPGDIAARDLLPHLRKSPNYLATKHMVVTDGPPGDPYGRTIKWANIMPADFPYAIRQLPGPDTALGALMLDSPNDFDVYLHDTPNKKRFASDEREISNGCVRVQQILPLASLAMTDDSGKGVGKLNQVIKTRQTQRLVLEDPLPVYFLYWTAVTAADGTVGFRTDRYGRDATLIAALTKAPRKLPAETMRPMPRMDAEPMDPDELSP